MLKNLLAGALVMLSLTSYCQDPNFHIYLMFGQSNMEGMGTIESQDRTTNSRVKVLQDLTCSNLSRTYGQWYIASPPLNRCWSGIGPGDYFGKTMADGTPSNVTIGLVPAAVSGCDIALYQKSAPIGRSITNGGASADIPTQFSGGYAWLLDLAKTAKKAGVIKGIIFHQGETNTGDPNWKYKVQEIVNDLRNDLGIGTVPFIAGELLYSQYGSCCSSHNVEVNKLPGIITNAYVVSASGLAGADNAHFTTASYRELGKRYAQKMLPLVSPCGIAPNGFPYCCGSSPDPDGDGWGWENNTSCFVQTSQLAAGTYKIVARSSGKVLDVAGSSTADGANVQQWTSYGNAANQNWVVANLGSGVYSIKASHSGKSLDVTGASTADGADINQWYYGGTNNQKWKIESLGSGYYRIVSVNSGKCIDIEGNSTADGAGIVQWPCSGTNNQSFTFKSNLASREATAPLADEVAVVEAIEEVYPNPSNGLFNASCPGHFAYSIKNSVGADIENGHGKDKALVGNNISSPGIYILQISSPAGNKKVKIIKR